MFCYQEMHESDLLNHLKVEHHRRGKAETDYPPPALHWALFEAKTKRKSGVIIMP